MDDTVLFKALEFEEIKQIVRQLIGDLRERLEERKVALDLSDEALELVAREGFDPVYGARPLHRFIRREIETRIARALVAGEAPEGAHARVGVSDGHLGVAIDAPA